MTFDVWIPKLNLALEYQGTQHYSDYQWMGEDRLDIQFFRDRRKLDACKSNNIHIIQVPHWWDGGIDSLFSTIGKVRRSISVICKENT
jgi:hypothetical protein